MASKARARSTWAAGALSERLRRVKAIRSSGVSGRRGSFWRRDMVYLDARGSPATIPNLTANDPLVVWPRDEVVRVDLERSRVLGPGLADGLEGGSPSEPLEVLGEVVGRDKGEDVGLQALQVGVVDHLDGGILHRPAHPLRLAVCPGVIG